MGHLPQVKRLLARYVSMGKILLLMSLCLAFSGVSRGKESIRQQVEALLPKELTALSSKDTRPALEKKFSSKIQPKKDPNTLYLHYFEDLNDVTIGTRKGQFDYLYVQFPRKITQKNPNFFMSVLKQLTEKQRKDISDSDKTTPAHDVGRTVFINLPQEGLKLEFFNNEKKDLKSVIFFAEGKQ